MNFAGVGFGSRLVRGRRSLHGSSVRRAIMMPALSPFMTQGTISRWLKKEGEKFQAGDMLLQIESEYHTIYVEAENSGILGKILSPDGSTNVPVEQVIALVSQIPTEIVHTEASTDSTPISLPKSSFQPHFTTGGGANLGPAKDPIRNPDAFSSSGIHDTTSSQDGTMDHAGMRHASAPTLSPQLYDSDYELHPKTVYSTFTLRGSGPEPSVSRSVRWLKGLLL
ncbi:hypothetical protein C8R45DRAFT_1210380 [Mycena sanguinolenta]|nr:hypothetical protein C8R45DRAFT_1210380 [Mycena sanguinolenta]